MFHINFHESEKKIGGIPENITYEVVYNTTILDETIRKYPDEISKKYKNNLLQPYWTSYTFTLQTQLDQIALDLHTNGVTLEYEYERVDELVNPATTAMMFFEIGICFAWCV